MQTRVIVLMGTMVALCAMGKPDLTGTPDELVAYLNDIPGRITLRAEGELAAEAASLVAAVGSYRIINS